jgi:hypothetical protein
VILSRYKYVASNRINSQLEKLNIKIFCACPNLEQDKKDLKLMFELEYYRMLSMHLLQ